MTLSKHWSSASALCSIFLILPPGLCHMEMRWPYPLKSKYNPENSYQDVDYSMTSPLLADGSNFPCKGYQGDSSAPPVITYDAGSTYNVTLEGSATHGGGSCQLSLSYDNGATFQVIKSMIGGCPLETTYDFTIPPYSPSGEALLAWTWQNKIGNREFYMNCAKVSIQAAYTGRRQRREANANYAALPEMWRANLAGINDCATEEGTDPVYPDPGPDVVYGDGMSSESVPAAGNCGGTTTSGSTSEVPVEDQVPEPYVAPPESSEGIYDQPATSTPTPSQDSAEEASDYAIPVMVPQARVLATSSSPDPASSTPQTYSTITVFADCPDTITMTIYPSPTTSVTRSPSAMTTSIRRSTRTQSWTSRTVSASRTYTSRPERPTPQPPANAPSNATGDLKQYLPCVPGTFICTSASTWQTCNWNSEGTAWEYGSPRDVAAGMMCLPNLSPYSSATASNGQQALVPAGFYRDDRYVRARPDGDCNRDGALRCRNGGAEFMICDHGGWIRMGAVAAGTTCRDGSILASG